jgi:hypothetical protein
VDYNMVNESFNVSVYFTCDYHYMGNCTNYHCFDGTCYDDIVGYNLENIMVN